MVKRPHMGAVGLLVLAALLWSSGGLLIKAIPWPPLAVSGGRGLIAALFLLATHRGLRFHFSPRQTAGAVSYAFCVVNFCVATKLTTAANAIVLQYTAPIWVALFGALLIKERPRRADWIAIAAVIAGLVLFFADSLELAHAIGNLFGLASGIGFAATTLALRSQKDTSAVESIVLGNLIAFAIGLPGMLKAPSLPASGWFALGLLGAVQLGAGYMLYARAIRQVTALEAVLISVIEPILNPVWVLIAIGERPAPLSLVGAGIVLTAVIFRAMASIRGPVHCPAEL